MNPVMTSFTLQAALTILLFTVAATKLSRFHLRFPQRSAFSPKNNKTTVTPAVLKKCVCLCVCVCLCYGAAQTPDQLRGKRGRRGRAAEEAQRPAGALPSHQDLQRDSCQTHLPAENLKELRCIPRITADQ